MDAEWVAVLLTLAGFLGSLVNALWARNERKAAAASASDAHLVQESMAASQATIAAALDRPSVAFEVVEYGRHWSLRNRGTGVATNLYADFPPWCWRFPGDDGEIPTELAQGEGIEFAVAPLRFGEKRATSMRVHCNELPDGVSVVLPRK